MTLIELSEFVKQFEETFEVTAAAPVAVAAGPAAAAAPPRRGEKDSFDVVWRATAARRSRSLRSCAS
jgi:large subunit ribosomal protein L7/L12